MQVKCAPLDKCRLAIWPSFGLVSDRQLLVDYDGGYSRASFALMFIAVNVQGSFLTLDTRYL